MLDWLDRVGNIADILMQTSLHMNGCNRECKVKAFSGQRFFLGNFWCLVGLN